MKRLNWLGISRARFKTETELDERLFEAEIYDEIEVVRFRRDGEGFLINVGRDPANPAFVTLMAGKGEKGCADTGFITKA